VDESISLVDDVGRLNARSKKEAEALLPLLFINGLIKCYLLNSLLNPANTIKAEPKCRTMAGKGTCEATIIPQSPPSNPVYANWLS
jgi:hypothetical protein